jgi:GIY-YIG domain-containing protein
MRNKLEAEKREAQLLDYFDYAWNQIHNGSCRHEEILSKLEKKLSSSQMFSSILQKIQNLKKMLYQKQVGVRIDKSVLFDKYMVPEVRTVGKSRPQVLQPGNEISLTTTLIENICGIALGDGSVCARSPMQGRKRCEDHKGRRIVETRKEILLKNDAACEIEEAWINACGAISEIDGSICKKPPTAGRKRCEDHKGRRKTTKQILIPIH